RAQERLSTGERREPRREPADHRVRADDHELGRQRRLDTCAEERTGAEQNGQNEERGDDPPRGGPTRRLRGPCDLRHRATTPPEDTAVTTHHGPSPDPAISPPPELARTGPRGRARRPDSPGGIGLVPGVFPGL